MFVFLKYLTTEHSATLKATLVPYSATQRSEPFSSVCLHRLRFMTSINTYLPTKSPTAPKVHPARYLTPSQLTRKTDASQGKEVSCSADIPPLTLSSAAARRCLLITLARTCGPVKRMGGSATCRAVTWERRLRECDGWNCAAMMGTFPKSEASLNPERIPVGFNETVCLVRGNERLRGKGEQLMVKT